MTASLTVTVVVGVVGVVVVWWVVIVALTVPRRGGARADAHDPRLPTLLALAVTAATAVVIRMAVVLPLATSLTQHTL